MESLASLLMVVVMLSALATILLEGSNPYTLSWLEKVAIYTLPLAMVGQTNLANMPRSSRNGTILLFHNSCVILVASKACRMPGTVPWLASPCCGCTAHI